MALSTSNPRTKIENEETFACPRHQKPAKTLVAAIFGQHSSAEKAIKELKDGGVISSVHLSVNRNTLQSLKDFIDSGKPGAAIYDGTLTILEASVVWGRRMTSPLSLRRNLENASAKCVEKDVVCDGKLVTSRKPDDIPAFDREMTGLFAEERALHRQSKLLLGTT